MSATTAASSTPRSQIEPADFDAPPFARLVGVEVRKMTDTRGGFWLLAITGLLLVLTIGLTTLVVATSDVTVSADTLSQVLTIPLSILLPVFAIATVTSEWSQRTGLVTFALEPRRGRVLLAKAASVTVLAMATIAVAVVLGALTNVLCGAVSGKEVVWDLGAGSLLLLVAIQLLYFFMAFGLAMVILSTPAAIAVFYVFALLMPFVVYGPLYAIFSWARDVVPWIDLQFATAPFVTDFDSVDLRDLAALASAVVLWVLIPNGVGTKRVLGAELK